MSPEAALHHIGQLADHILSQDLKGELFEGRREVALRIKDIMRGVES
jgi:hypothetical protein